MYGKPTLVLGLVPVGVVLCCCLGLGTLNIHCVYPLVFRASWILDVGHLLPSTIRPGDHDFCSSHEFTYHRPFVLEVMVEADIGLCGWVYYGSL